MKVKFKTYMLFLIMVSYACEEKTSWDFATQELNRLVVDGIITNELMRQKISVSVTNSDINLSPHPISGAVIQVSEGSNSYEFIESEQEPGVYYSDIFQAVINRTYHLHVQYQGKLFQALAEAEPVGVPDPYSIEYHSERQLFFYQFSAEGPPSMTKIQYDWSANSSFCSEYGNCFAHEFFYHLENTDVNALFSPDKQQIYFPSGTRLIRTKYSLSDSHQKFLRSLLMETEWSGGIFDVQHGNVTGNISNGGLGYFAVSMVVNDTIITE